MEALLDRFFEESGINMHKEHEEGDIIYTSDIELDAGTFNICVINASEYQSVTVFINSPIKVPEPNRSSVADYIALANFHFYEGNLMFDFEDGRVVYKYNIRYEPEESLDHVKYQLKISLGLGIEEMENHFPGINMIIYKNIGAVEAFQKVELGSNARLN